MIRKPKQLSGLLAAVVLSLVAPVIAADLSSIETSPKVTLPDSPCSFEGDFVQQKTISGLDQALESNGSFYYHCDNGVIWSTTAPVVETLIFSKSGDNWQIKDAEVTKLKTRQAKLLGKLLNSMMSGDQQDIEQKFTLSELESNRRFQLLPKKKSLKRAIKEIQLSFSALSTTEFPASANNALDSIGNVSNAKNNIEESHTKKGHTEDSTSEKRQTTIEIRDRKNQLTSITSSQTHDFAVSSGNEHNNCSTSGVPLASCDVLYPQTQ